jgi:hypothetical protein
MCSFSCSAVINAEEWMIHISLNVLMCTQVSLRSKQYCDKAVVLACNNCEKNSPDIAGETSLPRFYFSFGLLVLGLSDFWISS